MIDVLAVVVVVVAVPAAAGADRFMVPIGSIIRWLPRLMRFCSERLVYITRSSERSILTGVNGRERQMEGER